MTSTPVPAGLVVVRGAAHGAVAGLVAALLLFPIAVLLDGGPLTSVGLGFAVGVIVAPIGLVYGSVAGALAGAAAAPFRNAADGPTIVRLVVAIVGAVTVAVISWVWFRPTVRFEWGNLDDVAVYYIVPVAQALAAGLAFGHRLISPLEIGDEGDR